MALALLVVPVLSVAAPVSAQANVNNCLKQGTMLNGTLDSTCDPGSDAVADSANLTGVITTVVNVISIIVGVVAVIMIIWGGLKYITSGGESNKITGAKNTILYALIGLVVVALAQFIVRFVLAKATGVVEGTA